MDLLDPILHSVRISFNGRSLVEATDYTYNEVTGEFAAVAGKITVGAASYV